MSDYTSCSSVVEAQWFGTVCGANRLFQEIVMRCCMQLAHWPLTITISLKIMMIGAVFQPALYRVSLFSLFHPVQLRPVAIQRLREKSSYI